MTPRLTYPHNLTSLLFYLANISCLTSNNWSCPVSLWYFFVRFAFLLPIWLYDSHFSLLLLQLPPIFNSKGLQYYSTEEVKMKSHISPYELANRNTPVPINLPSYKSLLWSKPNPVSTYALDPFFLISKHCGFKDQLFLFLSKPACSVFHTLPSLILCYFLYLSLPCLCFVSVLSMLHSI